MSERVRTRTGIPTVVEIVDSGLRFCLPFEACVHVTDKMVPNVIANLSKKQDGDQNREQRGRAQTYMKLEEVAEFRKLAIEILVHSVEALLQLALSLLANGIMGRIVIDIGEEYGLRERRSYVLARAAVTVSASTDLLEKEKKIETTSELRIINTSHFVIEGTIDTVLLGAKDVSLD